MSMNDVVLPDAVGLDFAVYVGLYPEKFTLFLVAVMTPLAFCVMVAMKVVDLPDADGSDVAS